MNAAQASHDHAALLAAARDGAALCTIVAIDGGFSRRIGAQLAILPDGGVVGSLADNCLEHQLASDVAKLSEPVVHRYGRGSPFIDFRLPCGSGIDILLDPHPDRRACMRAADMLAARQPATLDLPANPHLPQRRYIPALALDIVGAGPEVECLTTVAKASGVETRLVRKDALSLGQRPDYPVPDRWTATVLLFHDHEWETAVLAHALSGDGFYVAAQGGQNARLARVARLRETGLSETQIDRIRAPVGLIPSCREPDILAVSILAEVFAAYEKLRCA
ncbi:XdhC family protein [Croceicoccus bisphenolivorans]|uniref:XdhC family protein n=1 Tax=Croceicoccus bisphenolivorans TaxID=1783232 RepID=UPI00083742AC|nr:XdhC family protein [Croceicoccus bisphenolivorans]